MNNLDNYLPEDIGRAVRLTKEFWRLTDELEEPFTIKSYHGARATSTRMITIVNELEWLQERKQNIDRLRKLSVDLESQVITVAIVKHAYE
ncbi:hypothetical protein [Halobacillus sp. Cin3]|uniref:hypothetical protein n=1 Tax=Halobacillus sp. Cin3 TaxID=2928441 RepID=UPI00248E03A7|nr:hypothetical protein [Halobacillus sp. Cin3]